MSPPNKDHRTVSLNMATYLENGINWFNPGKLGKNEHIACDLNLEWWQLKTSKPALGSFRKWKTFYREIVVNQVTTLVLPTFEV